MIKYKKEEILAIHGHHDASVTFIDKEGKLRVYEFERFVRKRYAVFNTDWIHISGHILQYLSCSDDERINFLELIKSNLFCKDIKLILYTELNDYDRNFISKFFPNAKYEEMPHHLSHTYSGLYNSGFDKCLIFSIDGGGFDDGKLTTTNIYHFENNLVKLIHSKPINYGYSYQKSSFLISELPETIHNNLSVAGKLMGLSAYGNIRNEWIEPFKKYYAYNFYTSNDYLNTSDIEELCKDIGFNYQADSVSGQDSYDIARTSQFVFENEIFDMVKTFVEEYNINVVMVGGCSLSVLLNQKIYEYLNQKGLKMYVPPCPNDSGLSLGMYFSQNLTMSQEEFCFNGIQILDGDAFIDKNNTSEDLTIKRVVEYLSQGKIIGILDGNSEVGPRALGNRSIICYPSFPEMKDTLNSKVKFREWFRPFAPVCKVEEKDLFFENATPSKYMSYAPTVKAEYKNKLSSITHVDNTARLQTVEEGCMFYDILSEMTNQDLIPVILNTSFNIKGKPILTRVEDAFYVLNNTEMDYLIYNNKIYGK